MTYIALLLWVFLSGTFCFTTNWKINFKKNKNIFIWLSFTPIIFLMGLRDLSVGVDTLNYYYIYNEVSKASLIQLTNDFYYLDIELGYVILMKIISYIGNYYFFQLVISSLICMLYIRFIHYNMEYYFIGIILFLGFDIFLLSMNITRQMLAILLIANSWTSLINNKKYTALLFYLLAGLTHTTSWVFFIIFVMYYFRENYFILRLIPVFGVAVIFSYETIIKIMSKLIWRYRNYYQNKKEIMTPGLSVIIWIIIAIISILLLVKCYYKYKKLLREDLEEKNILLKPIFENYVYSVFSLFYVSSYFIGLRFNYFERFGLYFAPFVILVFERYGNSIRNDFLRRLYFCSLTICFSVFFIIRSSTSQYIYNVFW